MENGERERRNEQDLAKSREERGLSGSRRESVEGFAELDDMSRQLGCHAGLKPS